MFINDLIQQNVDKTNENFDILQESGTSDLTASMIHSLA